MLKFPGENTVGMRVKPELCSERDQIIVEIFSGKGQSAGRGGAIGIGIVHFGNGGLGGKLRWPGPRSSGSVAKSITCENK